MTAGALDLLGAIRRQGGDVSLIAPDRLKVVAPATLRGGLGNLNRAISGVSA
jgi:hypothetical protein